MSIKIDDAYLYEHMPKVEENLMSLIPPEEELDHKFSCRFERKMKKLMKYERRSPKERKVYRGMKLAFAALAVVVLIAFGSAMSVKAYRFRFVEFIVEVFTELTSYTIQEERPEAEEIVPVEPGYVPEGYEKINYVVDESRYHVAYENEVGNQIYYEQMVMSVIGHFLDTEKNSAKRITVKGLEVTIIEENDVCALYWKDEQYVYNLLSAGNVTEEELIKMVRSVIKR